MSNTNDIFDQIGATAKKITAKGADSNGRHNPRWMDDWVKRYCPTAEEPVKTKDGGRKWVLPECLFDPDHKAPDAAFIEKPDGKLGYHCFHNSCSSRDWQAARDRLEPGWRDHARAEQAPTPSDQDAPRGTDTAEAAHGARRRQSALRREAAALDVRDGTREVGRAVLTRLADVAPETVRWLWPGRVPLGKLTLLDGDPGLGKSLITLDLVARVTLGDVMPDGVTGDLDEPAGVVILTAEDGLADTVRPRLEARGADLTRVVALTAVRRLPADPDAEVVEEPPDVRDLAALEEAIRAVGAALVVIDPLMAFLPDEVNAHRDQQVRRALAPLAALAERTGAALVVVRHLNKSTAANPLYRGGGSIGIIGAARAGLLVARDPDDESGARRVLAVAKCNVAAPVPALAYTVEVVDGQPVIAWQGESGHSATALLAQPERCEEKSAIADARAFLREVLAGGEMLVTELTQQARAAGISWRTVERAKPLEGVRSRREGFGRQGTWYWKLPEQPEQPTDLSPPTPPYTDNTERVADYSGESSAGCSASDTGRHEPRSAPTSARHDSHTPPNTSDGGGVDASAERERFNL